MNYTINNKTLLLAIDAVSDAVGKGAKKDFRGVNLLKLIPREDHLEIIADGGHIAMSLRVTEEFDPDLTYSYTLGGEIIVHVKEVINALKSFYPTDLLNFELFDDNDGGQVLYIKNAQQPDRYQMVSLMGNVKLGLVPKKQENEYNAITTVNKDVFIKGMSAVTFAFFYRETKQEVNCFVFDSDVDKASFLAGAGFQYAIDTFTGKVVDSKKKTRIVFPYFSLPTVLSIFKKLPVSDVKISDFYGDKIEEKMSHLYIESSVCDICLRGKQEELQDLSHATWTNFTDFVHDGYSNIFEVRLSDLRMPTKGIVATRDFELVSGINHQEHHYVIMSLDFAKEQVTLSTNTKLKSKSKINMSTIKNEEGLDKVIFSSKFLSDIVDNGIGGDIIRFHCDINNQMIYVTYQDAENEIVGVSEHLDAFFWRLPNDDIEEDDDFAN